jgi:hypothetical protein
MTIKGATRWVGKSMPAVFPPHRTPTAVSIISTSKDHRAAGGMGIFPTPWIQPGFTSQENIPCQILPAAPVPPDRPEKCRRSSAGRTDPQKGGANGRNRRPVPLPVFDLSGNLIG